MIIVIGASLGGLHALQTILTSLPAEFSLPIAIVQHREPGTYEVLQEVLQRHSLLPVCDAEDQEAIKPGHVYLAPADYHLLLEPGYFTLSTVEPVNYARPAIDVLFESAADSYGDQTVGIILTGLNYDGAQGLAAIKRRGGIAIVQDPTTAEAPDMPKAALAATPGAKILPLAAIGPFLKTLEGL
jgi:two-component system, chemotaxis family, protein-glutamate methylesterase/glutaminase